MFNWTSPLCSIGQVHYVLLDNSIMFKTAGSHLKTYFFKEFMHSSVRLKYGRVVI